MSVPDNKDLSHRSFLSMLHRQCQSRHGNLTTIPTISTPESSTVEDGEAEDTDFGAVMYIAAVLVFYSLGIVVMIVKYLKTERKELEEEMALDSFFKGIRSKKMEHNRDAVNRVAIRAFHTLTSGAKRQDQLLAAAQRAKQVTLAVDSNPTVHDGKPEASPHSEESDSSTGDRSPYMLHREPSKYLPRVSLMFRDNRPNNRRKTYDGKSGLMPLDNSIPPGQRSQRAASPPLQENGQAGFCLSVPNEQSEHSDSSLTSPSHGCNSASVKNDCHSGPQNCTKSRRKGQTSRDSSVRFVDERKTQGKPPSKNKTRGRARSSRPSQGHSRSKSATALNVPIENNKPNCSSTRDLVYGVSKPGSSSLLSNGSVSPVDCPSHKPASPTQLTVSCKDGLVHTTVTQSESQKTSPSSKRLLVSDV